MGTPSTSLGQLCLDFANTFRWHASERPEETLFSYDDLVTWARKLDVLTPSEAYQMFRESRKRVTESKSVLKRGIKLREAIYRIVVSYLHGQPPSSDDLNCLNRELELAHRNLQIAPTESGYKFVWTKNNGHLDRVLWPIALSAAELLTSSELLHRLGQCADDRGCGWLFIDRSKNHSRRWCDINDCGNRAKQRRHYHRLRKRRL